MNPVVILEILGILFDVAGIITNVAGDDATGQTEIIWGDSVSGIFEYYYIDENGATSLRSGNFSFSTSVSGGWVLVDGGNDVKITAIRNTQTSGTSPIISYSEIGTNNANIYWRPGSFYTTEFYIAGVKKSALNNVSLSMPGSSRIPTFYYSGSQGSTASTVQGHVRSTDFVTSTTGAQNFPDAVYLPISGQSMSYDDIRNELTNYVNNIILTETDTNGETIYSPDETIAPDDLPTWDDIQNPTETETDVTEPDYQPASIDYNEILSEDELESILKQETYEIPEIESITETIIIDIEDLVIEGTEQLEITDFIPDALAVGMDVFNELNISAPLTSVAVVACIWKIIKGR